MPPELVCSRCGLSKPATTDFFTPRPDATRGFSYPCRECLRKRERERYWANKFIGPLPNPNPSGRISCTKCGTEYPETLEFFGPDNAKRNGLGSWCRQCLRDLARARQAARRSDPEERKVVQAEKQRYARSPRGRAKKREHSRTYNHRRRQWGKSIPWLWNDDYWKSIKFFWGFQCAYCGRGDTDLHQDHVVPISSPDCPGTVPWNIVPACPTCNLSKGGKNLEEWADRGVVDDVSDNLAILHAMFYVYDCEE